VNKGKAMVIELHSPLQDKDIERLRAGDMISLSGVVYTGRDAAHKRFVEQLERGEPLPFDLKGQVIYYVGPCPAPPGKVIGSAGPTTSYRMDPYAGRLIAEGLAGMIGKGNRSDEVVEAMKKHGAVYFAAVGGAAALLASKIIASEVIAFEDLGTEAVRRVEFRDFPLVVVIDCKGNNLYQIEKARYRNL
jgi:fumarate hydratase subunit beta